MGTPRFLRAKKLVKIMPTKMRFTGNQSLTIAALNLSNLMRPAMQSGLKSLKAANPFKNKRSNLHTRKGQL